MRLLGAVLVVLGGLVFVAIGCGESDGDGPTDGDAGAGQASGGTAPSTSGSGGTASGGSATTGGAGSASSGTSPGGSASGGASSGGDSSSAGAGGDSLVPCDTRQVQCKRTPPECPVFQVPSVVDSCYGDCVKISQCACSQAADCPDPNQYTCWSQQHCGPFVR